MKMRYITLIMLALAAPILLHAQAPFIKSIDIGDLRVAKGAVQTANDEFELLVLSSGHRTGALKIAMDNIGNFTSEIDTLVPIRNAHSLVITRFENNYDGTRFLYQKSSISYLHSSFSYMNIFLLDEDTNDGITFSHHFADTLSSDWHCSGLIKRKNKVFAPIYRTPLSAHILIEYNLDTKEKLQIPLNLPDGFGTFWIYETSTNDVLIGGINRDNFSREKYIVVLDSSFQFTRVIELPKENVSNILSPLVVYLGADKLLNFTVFKDDSTGVSRKLVYCMDIKTGKTIWENETIVEGDFSYAFLKPILEEDGSIIIPGSIAIIDSLGEERRMITLDKYASDGSFVWSRTYTKDDFVTMTFEYVELLSDGRILGLGSTRKTNGELKPFVFITDENGCIEPECALMSSVPHLNEMPFELKMYPNPSSDVITVETAYNVSFPTSNLHLKGSKLLIKDPQGRICFQKNLELTFSGLRENVMLNDLPAGVYMVYMVSNSGAPISNIFKLIKQ